MHSVNTVLICNHFNINTHQYTVYKQRYITSATVLSQNSLAVLVNQTNWQIKWLSTAWTRCKKHTYTLAKRLTMRPDGVVSKNTMGTLRMFDSSCVCRILDASMAPFAKSIVPKNTRKPDKSHAISQSQRKSHAMKGKSAIIIESHWQRSNILKLHLFIEFPFVSINHKNHKTQNRHNGQFF